jgi:hypothetical protein
MTQDELIEAMKQLKGVYEQQPPPPPQQMQDNDINPPRDFANPSGDLYGMPVMPVAPQPEPFVMQPRLDMREIDPFAAQPWGRRTYRGGA